MVLIVCRTLPIVWDMNDVAGVASFPSASEYLPFGTRRSCHCARLETCQELMAYWLSFVTVKRHRVESEASPPRPLFPPRKEPLVLNEWEVGWAPELMWTFWRWEENSFPVRESKHDLILKVVSAVLIDKKNKGTRRHNCTVIPRNILYIRHSPPVAYFRLSPQ
jgi:hypothetical protein